MLNEHTHNTNEVSAGLCPCCKRPSTFFVSGEQRWPRAVAEKVGVPDLILLWTCESCLSTISETDLNFD